MRLEPIGNIMVCSWVLCFIFLLVRKPWANRVAVFFKVSGWVLIATIIAIKTFIEVIK